MNKTTATVAVVSALTKGMYTRVWNRETKKDEASTAFGLRDGQCGNDECAHNGGWYNKAGEKLGWGDLNSQQVLRISQEIQEWEVFYVLPEGASHWDFVRWSKKNDMSYTVAPDASAPGVKYVQEKCMWVIKRGEILRVSDYGYAKGEREGTFRNTFTYKIISPEMVKDNA